jgi:hypothetical protein
MNDESLTVEQELSVIMELGILENAPHAYLNALVEKIIREFKAESLKPVQERDYDQAFMTLTRILLAMRELITRESA